MQMPLADAPEPPARYTTAMIKILLVDDDPNLRRGIRMRLAIEPDFAVIGETGDGWEALRLAGELQPDVVVMEILLPSLDGLSAARRLREVCPQCRVIILTLHDEPIHRQHASQAGVSAFIRKHDSGGDLVAAIRNGDLPEGAKQ